MKFFKEELEIIANTFLEQNANGGDEMKPNYSNRDFMNAVIIFQTALFDKVYDFQNEIDMSLDDRLEMAAKLGLELKNLIQKYTGLNLHEIENFL